jgi:cytochrome c-type biogenesis protein CcmE
MQIKILAAGALMAIAVGLLAFAGLRDGWVFFLDVDQFVSSDAHQTQRVRLTGTVSPEDLQVSNAGLTANFFLAGETARLRVEYSGIIPDMFRAGHEVVVEGRLDEEGTFIADILMTKCGSRYESEAAPQPPSHPPVTAIDP